MSDRDISLYQLLVLLHILMQMVVGIVFIIALLFTFYVLYQLIMED